MDQQPDYAYRIRVRSSSTSDSVAMCGLVIAIASVFCFAPGIAIGLIIMLVGLCIPAKVTWLCDVCGNDVQPTSQLCPACQLPMLKAPFRLRLVHWAMIAVVTFLAGFGLWVWYMARAAD